MSVLWAIRCHGSIHTLVKAEMNSAFTSISVGDSAVAFCLALRSLLVHEMSAQGAECGKFSFPKWPTAAVRTYVRQRAVNQPRQGSPNGVWECSPVEGE